MKESERFMETEAHQHKLATLVESVEPAQPSSASETLEQAAEPADPAAVADNSPSLFGESSTNELSTCVSSPHEEAELGKTGPNAHSKSQPKTQKGKKGKKRPTKQERKLLKKKGKKADYEPEPAKELEKPELGKAKEHSKSKSSVVYSDAQLRTLIYLPPPVLILHLKRFLQVCSNIHVHQFDPLLKPTLSSLQKDFL